jgi:NTE family protein
MALCLSGGGYRAALFHLGVLRRLNELGTLARVTTISAVSGGSILAAFLAQNVRPWPASGRIANFDEELVPRFREFTKKNIRTLWVLKRALPWKLRDSTVAVENLIHHYESDIVQLALTELPSDHPRYVFCASDLSFGVNWVSERARIGSYRAGYVEPPPWSVARAVAASSCFPPAFEPMPAALDPARFTGGSAGAKSEDRDALVRDLHLTDGGLYDNLALEPIWKDHAVVLVSDGGATFDARAVEGAFKTVGRYLSVQGRQAASLRKRWLIAGFARHVMDGVYLGIGSTAAHFDASATGYSADIVDSAISEVRTDLDFFSDAEAAVLQNHGYLMASVAMSVHGAAWCDADVPDPNVPCPHWMDESRVADALAKSARRTKLGRWRHVEAAKGAVGAVLDKLR